MNNLNKKISLDCTIERKPDILAADLDGEIGMMNIDKGRYYGMDAVGSRIWGIIEKPRSLKEIVQTLCNEYDVEARTCEEHVVEFLNKLYAEDLISTT